MTRAAGAAPGKADTGVVTDLAAQVRAVVHRRIETSAVDDVVAGIGAVTAELPGSTPSRWTAVR
jgi:hypothetical protein